MPHDDAHTASDLEVVVLGAGPAYSDTPGALGSAFLVRGAGSALVLDLGQGTFPALANAIEPSSIRAVVISHLHPDHFIDLIPLRHYLCRMEFQPSRRLRLLAPKGVEQRLDGVYDQPGFARSAFDVEAMTSGHQRIGPFDLEVQRVRHVGEAFAFRVQLDETLGPGIVYSGDVGEADDLRPLVRAGDLLLSEATFGPGPVPPSMPHLDGPAVGRLARETGAGQVVLVHIRMGCDPDATLASAAREFAGPISVARPNDRYPVSVAATSATPQGRPSRPGIHR
jgi:ribonuclease BN (tRNA processing enzyme)